MKALVIFLSLFFCQLMTASPSFARGGDGVFPFELSTGRWETYTGKYAVRFFEIEGDADHLQVVLYGWDRQHPLAWGMVSQKTRQNLMTIEMVDNHGEHWDGILYRSGLGLNLHLSNGCREVNFELIDRNIPPHF